jgi:hypothetical protein
MTSKNVGRLSIRPAYYIPVNAPYPPFYSRGCRGFEATEGGVGAGRGVFAALAICLVSETKGPIFLYFSLTFHPFVVMFCLLLSPDLLIVLIESSRLVRGDIDVIEFSV